MTTPVQPRTLCNPSQSSPPFYNLQQQSRQSTTPDACCPPSPLHLSQALEGSLENLFVSLLVWGEDRKLRHLVRKNMSGHRRRTRKTHLMFTLSIAVIIFGGVVCYSAMPNLPFVLKPPPYTPHIALRPRRTLHCLHTASCTSGLFATVQEHHDFC